MKILELRLRNLNSLYGDWHIDFSHSEFTTNGIFALTGPTGAGKSTILDAICLALYGATPRLGRITKSGNDIMSRNSGDCMAEVVFQSQAGRFRCKWEHRRARKKADGKLQDQEHEISEADSGKPIETARSKTLAVVIEKTGMDFDRFTRSILLAQGGFDTFLKAGIEEKSKILEQITGTEIYTDISLLVHKRNSEEAKQLELLRAQISEKAMLSAEQEAELRNTLAASQTQEATLTKQLETTALSQAWLSGIEQLQAEIHQIDEAVKANQLALVAFQTSRETLQRAQQAATLDGPYATLKATRLQQERDAAALLQNQNKLTQLADELEPLSAAWQRSQGETQQTKEILKSQEPLWQKVRLLDQAISDLNHALGEQSEAQSELGGRIQTNKDAIHSLQTKRKAASGSLNETQAYINSHQQDEWLVANLAGLESQFAQLQQLKTQQAQKQNQIQSAKAALKAAQDAFTKAEQETEIKQKAIDECLAAVADTQQQLDDLLAGSLLREYRTQRDNLIEKKSFLDRIASLEQHRAQLQDGQECPLCGATEHPFAHGNMPAANDIDQQIGQVSQIIGKAEALQEQIAGQQAQLQSAQSAHAESTAKVAVADSQKAVSANQFDQYQQDAHELASSINSQTESLLAAIKPLGIDDLVQPEQLLIELRQRLEQWQAALNKQSDLDKKIAGLDSDIKSLEATAQSLTAQVVSVKNKADHISQRLGEQQHDRTELFGEKQPDQEQQQLQTQLQYCETTEQAAQLAHHNHQQVVARTQSLVESLGESIEQRTATLSELTTAFERQLQAQGFVDETTLLAAILSAEQRQALSQKAAELDTAKTQHQTTLKDRQGRLVEETAKELTDKTAEQLQIEAAEFSERLKEIQQIINTCQYDLKKDAEVKASNQQKQLAIQAQANECHRWQQLHDLIGSSDGKKYRNFAQGLTFEIMVAHANRQLEKMTDRYLLIRDEQEPLVLNVVDNYQAGEIRSTKNLSGGESFIVSLTLALGLSSMASQKVRVDSLFLDEGFGTLDEDTLETALDALASLHQEGKLIGVISHIEALKNRIACQIEVKPRHGGQSEISGPGCQKVV
ncbi:AAA family ATPase [Halioxenophilus aromaticivorans]|uniref:AAA family ATPase n=1 Tax=Halioxenophilus aromaticivorans TaxID=1306992 RepID=A0AAV3U2E6_9ALTE